MTGSASVHGTRNFGDFPRVRGQGGVSYEKVAVCVLAGDLLHHR